MDNGFNLFNHCSYLMDMMNGMVIQNYENNRALDVQGDASV